MKVCTNICNQKNTTMNTSINSQTINEPALTFSLSVTTSSALTLSTSWDRFPLAPQLASRPFRACRVFMESSTAWPAVRTFFSSAMNSLWSFLISSRRSEGGEREKGTRFDDGVGVFIGVFTLSNMQTFAFFRGTVRAFTLP